MIKGSASVNGNSIGTGANSIVELTFSDGSTLILGSNSSAEVGSASGGGFYASMGQGSARVHATPGSNIRIILPGLLLAGVRGTTFTVEGNSRSAVERTYEGSVRVENVSGRSQCPVIVKKGLQTKVRRGRTPTGPEKLKKPKKPFWE